MKGYRESVLKGATAPLYRHIAQLVGKICPEWNGGWRIFVTADRLFVLDVEFVEMGRRYAVNQFRQRYQYMPY